MRNNVDVVVRVLWSCCCVIQFLSAAFDSIVSALLYCCVILLLSPAFGPVVVFTVIGPIAV